MNYQKARGQQRRKLNIPDEEGGTQVGYNQDKIGTIKMAPKLREQHLDLPPVYGKIVVTYATQVISHLVTSTVYAFDPLQHSMVATTTPSPSYHTRMQDS